MKVGWRIGRDAFCRDVCAFSRVRSDGAPTCRQKASARMMRHPCELTEIAFSTLRGSRQRTKMVLQPSLPAVSLHEIADPTKQGSAPSHDSVDSRRRFVSDPENTGAPHRPITPITIAAGSTFGPLEDCPPEE